MRDKLVPKSKRGKRITAAPMKFEGALAEPIMLWPDQTSADGTPVLSSDAMNTLRQAQMTKWDETCRKFGVAPDSPNARDDMLLSVLEMYVPGWGGYVAETAAKTGPKPKWSSGLDIQLYHAAEKLMEHGAYELDGALLKLKREWKLTPSLSTLRKHYYTGKAKYARAMFTAQRYPDFARLLGIEPPV